jgi:hypothetical protein
MGRPSAAAAHASKRALRARALDDNGQARSEQWCWPAGSTSLTAGLLAGVGLVVATDDALLRLSPQGCVSTLSRGFGFRYLGGAVAAGRLTNGRYLVAVSGSGGGSGSGSGGGSGGGGGSGDGVLMIDAASAHTLGWWPLPTTALSDLVREDAGSALYAIDAASGSLLQLSRDFVPHPSSMFAPGWMGEEREQLENTTIGDFSGGRTTLQLHELRRLPLAHPRTPRAQVQAAHASGLLFGFGYAWSLWENPAALAASEQGGSGGTQSRMVYPSNLSFVELGSGALLPPSSFAIALRGPGGRNPCFHRGSVLYLDSVVGGLARLSPGGGNRRLWAAGRGYESRGLAVVDDLAIFGLHRRQASEDPIGSHKDPNLANLSRHGQERVAGTLPRAPAPTAPPELVAYDLRAQALLWRLPLKGSSRVNGISAPTLSSHACTWRACSLQLVDEHAPKPEDWADILGVAMRRQFTWILPPSKVE